MTKENITPKDFYRISEFYTFIKNPDNSPTASRLHVVVPYPHAGTMYFKSDDLYRFALSIQNIPEMPDFTSLDGDQSLNITNPAGRFTTLNQSLYGVSQNKFKIQFMEMMMPIHETFLYPWYLATFNANSIKNNYKIPYPFPRLDFAIKFYRTDSTGAHLQNVKQRIPVFPTFIYWITRSISNISRNI